MHPDRRPSGELERGAYKRESYDAPPAAVAATSTSTSRRHGTVYQQTPPELDEGQDVDVPEFAAEEKTPMGHSKKDSMVLPPGSPIVPPSPVRPLPPSPATPRAARAASPPAAKGKGLPTPPESAAPAPAAPGPVKSKTAALIEMYREREQGGSAPPKSPSSPSNAGAGPQPPLQPIQQPAPSKLPMPIRTLPQTPAVARPPPGAAPAQVPGLSSPALPSNPVLSRTPPAPAPPAISTSPVPHAASTPELVPPPPIVPGEESGRASPGRYIHGAPLHNVLEEEEEEV